MSQLTARILFHIACFSEMIYKLTYQFKINKLTGISATWPLNWKPAGYVRCQSEGKCLGCVVVLSEWSQPRLFLALWHSTCPLSHTDWKLVTFEKLKQTEIRWNAHFLPSLQRWSESEWIWRWTVRMCCFLTSFFVLYGDLCTEMSIFNVHINPDG